MMKILVSDLQEGQVYTEALYIDDENMIVPAHLPIKGRDIKQLQKWGVELLNTEGVLAVDEIEDNTPISVVNYTSETQRSILQEYAEIVKQLRPQFDQIEKGELIDPAGVTSLVDGLYHLVKEHKDKLIEFILYGSEGELDFIENAINSAILSMIIGSNLNIPQHKLVVLGTGALLHDTGMLRMPEELRSKTGKLTKNEFQTIRSHPVMSYKVLVRELGFSDEIGLIAIQHHERWDGEGYPKALSGDKISLMARIVSITDAFQAMVSQRPYRDPMTGYTAMRAILSDNGRRFDPEILKVFIKSMGMYPAGSIIQLGDGAICRVLKNHKEAPLRPVVSIIIDQNGRRISEDSQTELDLLQAKQFYIARAIDPKDFGKMV